MYATVHRDVPVGRIEETHNVRWKSKQANVYAVRVPNSCPNSTILFRQPLNVVKSAFCRIFHCEPNVKLSVTLMVTGLFFCFPGCFTARIDSCTVAPGTSTTAMIALQIQTNVAWAAAPLDTTLNKKLTEAKNVSGDDDDDDDGSSTETARKESDVPLHIAYVHSCQMQFPSCTC